MKTYIIISVSIFVNLLMIFFFEKISKIINIYDKPDFKRKIHKLPIPSIGGIFIIINFLLYFFIYFIFFQNHYFNDLFLYNYKIIFSYIVSLLLVFYIGIYDDKYSLSFQKKLFFTACIFILYLSLDQSSLIDQLNLKSLGINIILNNFSFLFTLLCLLVYLNAVNMFDGINLQCGVYFFAVFFIFFLNVPELKLLSIVIMISLLAFLFLNYQSKLFLGDSGCFILSFITSILFIKLNNREMMSSEEVFIYTFIPVIDMVKVTILRIAKNKSPFKSDDSHLHHIVRNVFDEKTTLFLLISSKLVNLSDFVIVSLTIDEIS